MAKLILFSSLAVIFMAMQLSVNAVAADNITMATESVFKFQQRLAKKGNAHAQYRLGSMYEFGIGTKENLPKANEWYIQATKKGNVQAENRLTYLEIRKNGFDKKIHTDWLKKIKKEVGANNQQAAMLLGQMYSYGIGVKKNLNKSIQMLNRAGVFDNPAVIYEIERVEKEINQKQRKKVKKTTQSNPEAKNKAKKAAEKKAVERKAAKKKAAERKAAKKKAAERKAAEKKAAEKKAEEEKAEEEKAATKEADEKAEKRRRYEEVMRKIKEEERIIEEQQAWSEGKRQGADEKHNKAFSSSGKAQ